VVLDEDIGAGEISVNNVLAVEIIQRLRDRDGYLQNICQKRALLDKGLLERFPFDVFKNERRPSVHNDTVVGAPNPWNTEGLGQVVLIGESINFTGRSRIGFEEFNDNRLAVAVCVLEVNERIRTLIDAPESCQILYC